MSIPEKLAFFAPGRELADGTHTALSNVMAPIFGRDQVDRVPGSPLPLVATLTVRVPIEPGILPAQGEGDDQSWTP